MFSVTVIIYSLDFIPHILKDDCRLQYLHFDSVGGVLHPVRQIPCFFWIFLGAKLLICHMSKYDIYIYIYLLQQDQCWAYVSHQKGSGQDQYFDSVSDLSQGEMPFSGTPSYV